MTPDEEKNDVEQEETTEAPPEETAAEETPAPSDEAPADTGEEKDEAAPEQPDQEPAAAEAGDDAAEEAADAEAPAEASQGDDGGAGEGGGGAGDDELGWKAKRRLERSRQPHEAGPERKPAERQAERDSLRAKAAKERSARRKKVAAKRKASAGEGTPPAEHASAVSKERQGTVVSSKADKSITVRIDLTHRHPVYEKVVRRSHTLHAHDERNEAGEGDVVRVVETRPLSRTKRWRLVEVVEKAK